MVVLLTGGSAAAYHCYNASASEQGSEGMGASPAFYTLGGVFTDLCGATTADANAIVEELIVDPDGVYLNDYDDSLWDVQISVAAHMAGGLEFWYSPNADQLWHDGKGIDHLGTDLESFIADVYTAALKVAGLDLDTCE